MYTPFYNTAEFENLNTQNAQEEEILEITFEQLHATVLLNQLPYLWDYDSREEFDVEVDAIASRMWIMLGASIIPIHEEE